MTTEYVIKAIPAVRLAALTATLAPAELSDHIGPMFDVVSRALTDVGSSLATPIATYSETEAGMAVVVGYAYPGPPLAGTEIIDLPEAIAVCGVHLGSMIGIRQSWQQLHRWVLDNGYRSAGPSREFYVKAESADQHDWVTELQQPIIAT